MHTHMPSPLAPSAALLAQLPAIAPGTVAPAPPESVYDLPGLGLPQDRHARIAARRTFVALKHRFMTAVADVGGQRAEWLRFQVRQAQEPVDLWLLRGMVFDALEREGPATERTRRELGRVLDSVFPNNGELQPYGVRA